jgi:hypothetical protein
VQFPHKFKKKSRAAIILFVPSIYLAFVMQLTV